MQAGRLRHRVTFETLIVGMDSDGAQTEDWIEAFEVSPRMPAEVTALSGRELIAAQAVHSRVSTRIRTRYRPGFDPLMRIRLGGTLFNVEAVIPDADSRIRFVTFLCSSGVTDGK